MKKIIIACDGPHFSEGAFEFARRINDMQTILLTGVFLPRMEYVGDYSYADGVMGPFVSPVLEDEDLTAMELSVQNFERLCQRNGIEYRIHRYLSGYSPAELRKETRFADLMIIGSEAFFKNLGVRDPNEFLKKTLFETECPVLIIPEKFEFPDSNILAFDGSESSVYAIKQFAYLFPELSQNNTLLVYADEQKAMPDESFIEELAARHFSDLTLFRLSINPKKEFSSWIRRKQGSILVCGGFGRTSFSQFLKKSFVSDVIRDHQIPVFISHK